MKKIIILFCSVLFPLQIVGQHPLTILSPHMEEAARCTGSASCRACTNCSRCAHCSNGGSCGVCARGTNPIRSTSSTNRNESARITNSTLRNFTLRNESESNDFLKAFVITTNLLNLRYGPGSNYSVKSKLTPNQKIFYLAKTGDWVKVRVNDSGLEGFVHSHYIKISEN